jgi:hypothetical protein
LCRRQVELWQHPYPAGKLAEVVQYELLAADDVRFGIGIRHGGGRRQYDRKRRDQ